jgi:hypothetical protein
VIRFTTQSRARIILVCLSQTRFRLSIPDVKAIAALKDGDEITIDISKRVLRVELTDAETREGLTHWRPPKPRVTRGYLARYAALAEPTYKGAYLRDSP